jgi:hypothetical protein
VAGSFAANNSEALRDAAVAGLGIALLPDFSAQDALRAGRLVQVLPDWDPVNSFGDFIYAVRPYSAHVPRAVAAFVDYLKNQYASGITICAPSPSETTGLSSVRRRVYTLCDFTKTRGRRTFAVRKVRQGNADVGRR